MLCPVFSSGQILLYVDALKIQTNRVDCPLVPPAECDSMWSWGGGGVLGVGGGSGRACLFGALAECLFFSAIQWESTWVTRSHIHWNKVENANAPRSRFLLGSGAALVSLLSCPNDDGDNTRGGQASDWAKGRLGKDGGVQGEGWAVVISLIWNAASYDISVIHAAFWLTLY